MSVRCLFTDSEKSADCLQFVCAETAAHNGGREVRYRISKAQIKMLLDGESLNTGNGRHVLVLKDSEVYKELEKIMANPATADRAAFFTDGVTIFVEEEHEI